MLSLLGKHENNPEISLSKKEPFFCWGLSKELLEKK